MKDEALKLALETFEGLNHEDSIFAGEFEKEITAIKQALAEPVRKHLTGLDIYLDPNDGLKPKRYPAAQPAPVQEPMHSEIKKLYEDYFDKWFRESSAAVPENFIDALRFDTAVRDVDAMIALARADEREQIAQMIEDAPPLMPFAQNDQGGCMMCGFTPKVAAAAIRARGNT
jgi:acyl-CoA hydrolase